ncbi:MAG: hypothetical protein NTW08_02180 [Gammaproteobacteria bacterium]|nr:hypothetical protein [Gammaproteobacteria bacterium]
MHPNLIFLEQHNNSGSRDFLIANLKHLKTLGYRTLMLETPTNVSVDQLLHMTRNCRFPTEDLRGHASRQYFNMLTTAKSLGFECYGIDDPFASKLQAIELTSNPTKCPSSELRDTFMSNRIMHESQQQGHGVIFSCGFLHSYLPRFLRQGIVPSRVIIIDIPSQTERYATEFGTAEPFGTWKRVLSDVKERHSLYQRAVHVFNGVPSFEEFDGLCQISDSTSLTPCEPPQIGRDFNHATQLPLTYATNSQHVLFARFQHSDIEKLEAVSQAIQYAFPGVATFFRPNPESKTKELVISGMNLPDQQHVLAKFIKQ